MCSDNVIRTTAELGKISKTSSNIIRNRIAQAIVKQRRGKGPGITDPCLLAGKCKPGKHMDGSPIRTTNSTGRHGNEEYRALSTEQRFLCPLPANAKFDDLYFKCGPAGTGGAALYVGV